MFDYSKLSVVVDFGSSKVRGFIGFMNGNSFAIVAHNCIESIGVQDGVIRNLDTSSGCLKKLMTLLNNEFRNKFMRDFPLQDPYKIAVDKIYVGISAAKIQGIHNQLERNLAHEEVTNELMRQMAEDNKNTAVRYPGFKMIHSNLVESEVDGVKVNNPKGYVCNNIVSTYHNVYAKDEVVDNIKLCFSKLGYENVEIIYSAAAQADLFLNEMDREAGALLVDLGAQVTSVSVFYKGAYYYSYETATGSDRITKDLVEVKIPDKIAEMIKTGIGSASASMEGDYKYELDGCPMTFESKVVNSIIENRVEKIIGRIEQIVRQANLSITQFEKIVLVGDGSKLKNLKEKMEESLGVRVEFGVAQNMRLNGNATCLSLLKKATGNSYRVYEDVPVEEETKEISSVADSSRSTKGTTGAAPQKRGTNRFSKVSKGVSDFLGNLFSNTDEKTSNFTDSEEEVVASTEDKTNE